MNEWTAEGELSHSAYREEGGTLYYFTEENPHIGSRFADLAVWDRIPDISDTFIDDVRKVKLELSRSAIRLGFRIRLL